MFNFLKHLNLASTEEEAKSVLDAAVAAYKGDYKRLLEDVIILLQHIHDNIPATVVLGETKTTVVINSPLTDVFLTGVTLAK